MDCIAYTHSIDHLLYQGLKELGRKICENHFVGHTKGYPITR